MSALSEETIRRKCEQEPWVLQTHNHVRFGAVPKWLEDMAAAMPDGAPEQAGYIAAAEIARDIYREQIRAAFNFASLADSRAVEAMCQAEPWTSSDSIEKLSNGRFGYLTEKFEHARDYFAPGSDEYQVLDDAFEKAKLVYFGDLKSMARRFATGKTRADIEVANTKLWHWAGQLQGNGTYLSARLVKLCEWNSIYQRDFGQANPQDPSKMQFRARFGGGRQP